MDALGKAPTLDLGSARPHRRERRTTEPAVRVAWALFLAVGVPLLLMAVLTVLAEARIYVEPLRPLWVPWPPDVLKPFLGIGAFAATLGYLAFRVGRSRGYRSGELAGLAVARNLAEGWKPPGERGVPQALAGQGGPSPVPNNPPTVTEGPVPIAPPPA